MPELHRWGHDIVVVWDAEDPATDVRLKAGLLLAKALAVRANRHDEDEAASLSEMDAAIEAIRKQIAGFEEIQTSASTIVDGGEKILKRARMMEDEIGKRLAALDVQLDRLRACDAGPDSDQLRHAAARRPHLYSATDLVGFLECEHLTALDLRRLRDPRRRAQSGADEAAELFARKGDEHERAYLARLRAEGAAVVDIAAEGGAIEDKVARTLAGDARRRRR